jgi:hypothetical protein
VNCRILLRLVFPGGGASATLHVSHLLVHVPHCLPRVCPSPCYWLHCRFRFCCFPTRSEESPRCVLPVLCNLYTLYNLSVLHVNRDGMNANAAPQGLHPPRVLVLEGCCRRSTVSCRDVIGSSDAVSLFSTHLRLRIPVQYTIL